MLEARSVLKRAALGKSSQASGYFSRRTIMLLLIAVPAVAWIAFAFGIGWVIG